MTKDEICEIILANVARDLEYYRGESFRRGAYGHHRNRRGMQLMRKARDAVKGIAPYRPSEWLGRPLTNSERIKFSRTLPEIEEEGLLVCYTDSRGRTTHVGLTEEGLEVAQYLSIACVDCPLDDTS